MGDKKDKIKKLYFEEKYTQRDIAKKLNVSTNYISKILKTDIKYLEEKNNRKRLNKIKHNKDIQRRVESKRKKQDGLSDIQILKKMHEQASFELSAGKKIVNNIAFRNWNKSIYKYNSKSQSYVLKNGITVGRDVPKRINWKAF
ncbi:MAG: hypothetical protein Q4G09_03010 [Clostridia bacterium]|nr:hypothetical protein [Clostridia bacterium]